MAKMIGRTAGTQGCVFGKTCTCNQPYRNVRATRTAKRRERAQWKREVDG